MRQNALILGALLLHAYRSGCPRLGETGGRESQAYSEETEPAHFLFGLKPWTMRLDLSTPKSQVPGEWPDLSLRKSTLETLGPCP